MTYANNNINKARYAESNPPVCPTPADGGSEEGEFQFETEDILPGNYTQQSVGSGTI